MNKEQYQERKILGLCAWGKCPKPRQLKHTLCYDHMIRHRKHSNKYQTAIYWNKKTSGICVSHACNKPCGDERVLCDGCWEVWRARKRKWSATPRGKKIKRRIQKKWRLARKNRGVCMRCERPVTTKTLCDLCAQMQVDYYRRRVGKPPTAREHCSNCGKTGHRIQRCKERSIVDMPLEFYATSRVPVDVL